MNRRTFLCAFAASVAASPLTVSAQPTSKVPTIGFLGPPRSVDGLVQAFQQGLIDFGYVEGRNVKVEYRYNVATQGNIDRLAELTAELVRLKPDVLVVSLTEVAILAKNATSTIPIVMANVADPVAAGLVSGLAHPGGNITGLSRQTPELVGKQFQLLKEMLPKLTRIGVLLNPTDRLYPVIIGNVRETAESLGVQVQILGPATAAELEGAFSTLRAERVGTVLVGDGGVLYLSRTQIADLALRYRLPMMANGRAFVEAGALISYSPSNIANYRRAAYFVDKILKGAKPADLPVEQPAKFELIVNQKSAKALGLTIPQALLLRADEVVQ